MTRERVQGPTFTEDHVRSYLDNPASNQSFPVSTSIKTCHLAECFWAKPERCNLILVTGKLYPDETTK